MEEGVFFSVEEGARGVVAYATTSLGVVWKES